MVVFEGFLEVEKSLIDIQMNVEGLWYSYWNFKLYLYSKISFRIGKSGVWLGQWEHDINFKLGTLSSNKKK